MGMKSIATIAAVALAMLSSNMSVLAQADGCTPVPAGPDSAVYFQAVTDTCTADMFINAADAPVGATDDGGALPPDQFVLATSITRDDGAAQLLVLVKPWSVQQYAEAIVVSQKLLDTGFDDGHSWGYTTPLTDDGN